MSKPTSCTKADVSLPSRFMRQNRAAIQMVKPLAAKTDAVIVTMLMGASLRHNTPPRVQSQRTVSSTGVQ